MIANKHITRVIAMLMAIAVCLCLCAMVYSEKLEKLLGSSNVVMEYESKLFDTDEKLYTTLPEECERMETWLNEGLTRPDWYRYYVYRYEYCSIMYN